MTIKGIDLDKLTAALEYCDTGSCADCIYYTRCVANECQSAMHQDAKKVIRSLVEMVEKDSPLQNCVNCGHSKVCMTARFRRMTESNDYTPCENWQGINE